MKLLSLYAEKNHFLRKFVEINDKELIQFSLGIFDGLEVFYENREKLLEIIRYIDAEIETEQKDLFEIEDDAKVLIQELIEQKNELIDQVLRQDLDVITLIEKKNLRSSKIFRTSRKTKKVFLDTN